MLPADFQRVLDRTEPLPDGRYLAVASRFVPGIPKGPFYFDGTRREDPNDWYHHEFRRELRGLLVVSSWLNHVDMRFANTMDAYVEPGYLRHYLIDFAASLGSGTIRPHNAREGAEYNFDLWRTMGRMFTLGFYREDWEGADQSIIDPSIGWLRGADFSPGDWTPNWPNEAFASVTSADAYWAAKIVGAFEPEHIRAAVAAGRLPNQFATDTLTTILETRRDLLVEYWYSKVSPVENARVTETREDRIVIEFEDYGILDRVWTGDSTVYRWRMEEDGSEGSVTGESAAVPGEHRQVLAVPLPGDHNPERLLELSVQIVRASMSHEPPFATVYLRRDPTRPDYQVVGLSH